MQLSSAHIKGVSFLQHCFQVAFGAKLFLFGKEKMGCCSCWKMCASATMVSLKFPLQDPPQQAASSNATTISSELIFCTKTDLFIQHSLETIRREALVASRR